jgi:hypothetical protein
LAKRGLSAKAASELAKAPAPIEEPWLVLVAGNNPPPVDRRRMTPFAMWQLTESGELTPKPPDARELQALEARTRSRIERESRAQTAEEANAEIRRYVREDFAKEHPHLVKPK